MNRKAKLLPFYKKNAVEAGCDEAGRGCLAGPVYAAAVILPTGFELPLLNDSKQLSEKQRYQLRPLIIEAALAWAVGVVDNNEIDKLNILKASWLAMHRAIDQLSIQPDHLIIDGNRFQPYGTLPHECIVKGDGKYLSIAAASVLAKTFRDDYMLEQAKEFSGYGWERNKGYPTRDHRDALMRLGPCSLHRRTFRLFSQQLELDL